MRRAIVATIVLALALASGGAAASRLHVERLKVPPGFSIDVWTDAVPGARSLTLGGDGVVFVATRSAGKVYAVLERGGRREVRTIASGLHRPNGVAYREGTLYVAEVSRVLRFDKIDDRLDAAPPPVVLYDRLPKDEWHGWKFLALGPDGWLYFNIGAPCNICDPPPPYASIVRLARDGSLLETYASGVRNSVGMDWHPQTKELWFTDNGRDWLGDDSPDDELNVAPRPGLHFGFPYCHVGDIADPEYGTRRRCGEFTPPVAKLGPHVAALGMRFYTGSMFPPEYQNRIFIAEHGSWNRSQKIGYRVADVTLTPDGVARVETFAEGWLQGQSAWGRPVDVLVMPDGALLVSDDEAGAIYRVTYRR